METEMEKEDFTPDELLDRAKGTLAAVLVIGWARDGGAFSMAASGMDVSGANILLDLAKRRLLDALEDYDDGGDDPEELTGPTPVEVFALFEKTRRMAA